MKAVVLAGGMLAAGAAMAAGPNLPPSRDVTVTYVVQGEAAAAIPGLGGETGQGPPMLTLYWSAGSRRLRVDAAGRPQSLLLDLSAHTGHVVDTGLRSALTLAVRDRDIEALLLHDARLTRPRPETVAGLPCTGWDVVAPRGRGTVCVTEDGVPLRAEGKVEGRQGSFTATRVSFDPVPPDRLRVPDGYFALDLPGLSRLRGLALPR